MSKKLTSLNGTVRKISGTNDWEVVEPFFWWIDYNKKDNKIEVPKGFRTNFGSIPRFLWLFLSPTEWNAFVLHDYMYYKQDTTRDVADYALYEALTTEGCWKLEAFIIWLGVRIGGWYSWYLLK